MINYSNILKSIPFSFLYIILYYEDRTVQKSARQLQRMLLKRARCRFESRFSLRPDDLFLQRVGIRMNDVETGKSQGLKRKARRRYSLSPCEIREKYTFSGSLYYQ